MAEIPLKLTHFNLFVEGKGFAGLINEIELPKPVMKTEDHMSGGMDVPIPVEMNMEPLEAKFTMASYEPEIFRLFGFHSGGSVSLISRGALKRDDEVIPMELITRGKIPEIDMGTWKKGEDTSMSFMVKLDYYLLRRGSEVLLEVDGLNTLRVVNGVDQLEAVRDALLI